MIKPSTLAAFLAPSLLAGTLALTACTDREVASVDPRQNIEQGKEIPVDINRNIDILFVIDDSGSMREEQASLAANFNRFINVLNNIEGGLPNVHIGVVSTDMGPASIGGCANKGGVLQNTPQGACSGPSDRYISDVGDVDGNRTRNYSGDLADTFSCIAELGTGGCGFEQPLEAMRRALDNNAMNNGFIREDAFLAVIIISDEDDCSASNVGVFDDSPAQDQAASELGFLTSFRCFEFGVTCEPDAPRSVGPRQDCVPRDESQYLYEVSQYATFLKGLKDDPSKIIVAGIIGNPTPVSVGLDDENRPRLEASCTSLSGEAAPAVRLNAFLDAFPQRSTTTTICNDDLSDALTVIADLLAKVLGNPCIDGDLALTDGEPECTVSDVTNLNQDGQIDSVLPRCNASASNVPCYRFESDPVQCTTPTQLTLVIERGNTETPDNTTVVARCVAN